MLVVVCCWLNTSYLCWCCYFGIILKKIIQDKRLKSGTAIGISTKSAWLFHNSTHELTEIWFFEKKKKTPTLVPRFSAAIFVNGAILVRHCWNVPVGIFNWLDVGWFHMFFTHPNEIQIFLEQKSDFTLLEIVGWEIISGRRCLDWEVPRSSHRKNSSPRWVSA